MRDVKHVGNPTDSKEVCGSILNGLVSYGSFQTWPSSASGAGTVPVSALPAFGSGGSGDSILDSSGAGTLLEAADGKTTALAPGRGHR